jgi:hypothetical protein
MTARVSDSVWSTRSITDWTFGFANRRPLFERLRKSVGVGMLDEQAAHRELTGERCVDGQSRACLNSVGPSGKRSATNPGF